jgi:hypothetical protein
MFASTVRAPDKLSVPDTVKVSFLSTILTFSIFTVGLVPSTTTLWVSSLQVSLPA